MFLRRTEVIPQWYLFLRNRHMRESQQEYSVAALLSCSSSIRATICLNAVAPLSSFPLGTGQRENLIQTMRVQKRTKQLVAQVAGHGCTKLIYRMSDLCAHDGFKTALITVVCLTLLCCQISDADQWLIIRGQALLGPPLHLLCFCSLRWKLSFQSSDIQGGSKTWTNVELTVYECQTGIFSTQICCHFVFFSTIRQWLNWLFLIPKYFTYLVFSWKAVQILIFRFQQAESKLNQIEQKREFTAPPTSHGDTFDTASVIQK